MDPTDLLSTPANYATPAQLQQMREYAASLQKNVLSGNLPISTRHPAAGIINALLQGAVSGSTFNRANEAQQQQRGAQADFLESLAGTGGGNPAGPTGAMNQPIPGTMPSRSTASADDQEDYIKQAAAARGIDPNVALQVHRSEASPMAYAGDDGSSFGPFQLHYGGVAPGGNASSGLGDEFTKATGLDARDPATAHQQIDFALDYAAKNGWGPWHGWKGEPMAGIGGSAAQQPTQVAMNGAAMPSSDTQSMVTALAGGSGTQPQQPQAHGGGMQLAQNSPNPYAPMFHMLAQGVRNGTIDPQIAAIQAMQLRQSMMPQYTTDDYGRIILTLPGSPPRIAGQIGPGKPVSAYGVPAIEKLDASGNPSISTIPMSGAGAQAPAPPPSAARAPLPAAPSAGGTPVVPAPATAPAGTASDVGTTAYRSPVPMPSATGGVAIPPMPTTTGNSAQDIQSLQAWQAQVKAAQEGAAEAAKETAKGQAKTYADKYEQIANRADSAQAELPQLQMLQKVMSNPQYYSGLMSGTAADLDMIGKALGVTSGDMATLSQFAKKLGSSQSLEQVREMGQAGAVRVPEMRMIEKSNYDPENTAEANRAVVAIHMRATQRAMQLADMANQYKSVHGNNLDPGFDQWVRDTFRKDPLFTDQQIGDYEKLFTKQAEPGAPAAPGAAAQPVQIPKGMSPADVKAKYKSGTHIVLPDGTTGIVP